MVFAVTPMAQAQIQYDFETDLAGGRPAGDAWTVIMGVPLLFNEGGNIGLEAAFANGNRSHDGAHPSLLVRSPEFALDGSGNLDFSLYGGTSNTQTIPITTSGAIPVNSAGGGGWQGGALRRVSDDTYVLSDARNANGGGWQVNGFSAAQLAPFVGDGEMYTLDFVDYKNGGWGWVTIDYISIPGGFSDGDLTSDADGIYSADTTWVGTVGPPTVPTNLSNVEIIGPHTVTVTNAAVAQAQELNIEAGGTLALNADGVTGFNTVNINGGAVTIPSGGTFTAGSSNTDGMVLADATVTLDVADLRVDSALALADYTPVAGNDVRVVAGGTFTTVGEMVGAAETVNLILDGGTLIDATGLGTTDANWGNFNGGLIHSSTILNGDKDIIVNAPGSAVALTMSGVNNATTPKIRIEKGALRGLPGGTAHLIELASNDDAEPAAFELSADGTITLGTAVQEINIVDRGSFASAGGIGVNVDITLAGTGLAAITDPLQIGQIRGGLRLGSRSATGSTTLLNDIDFVNAEQHLRAYASEADPDYFARLGGTLTNVRRIRKYGDGTLELGDVETITEPVEVHEGTLRIAGELDVGGSEAHNDWGRSRDFYVWVGARAEVTATGRLIAHRIDPRNGGVIDIAGFAYTPFNREHVRIYNGGEMFIRDGGVLQVGYDNNDPNRWNERGIEVYDNNALLEVDAGGLAQARWINARRTGTIDVSGIVRATHGDFNMHNGGRLKVRDGGIARSGGIGGAGDYRNTHFDNWDGNAGPTHILIEDGGRFDMQRGHVLTVWSFTSTVRTAIPACLRCEARMECRSNTILTPTMLPVPSTSMRSASLTLAEATAICEYTTVTSPSTSTASPRPGRSRSAEAPPPGSTAR